MYARVAQVRIRPEQVPDATRIYQENVVPALQQQPGFKGVLLLTQPDSGRGISITLWDTEAARTSGEVGGFYSAQLTRFAGMFTETPVRDAYEATVVFAPDASSSENPSVITNSGDSLSRG